MRTIVIGFVWSNRLYYVFESALGDLLEFHQFWNTTILSCPLLALQLGEYWFRISLYLYYHNRPPAPILRQRWCSLMYDVCQTGRPTLLMLSMSICNLIWWVPWGG